VDQGNGAEVRINPLHRNTEVVVRCPTTMSDLWISLKLYIAHILSLHEVPKTIVSDRGPQFVSKFWEELHKSLGTKLLQSLAYHPQTSGQTKE
jgi:transposase InsO family protein